MTLISTSSSVGATAPSLTVEDKISEPNTSLMEVEDDASCGEGLADTEDEDRSVSVGSRAELNPEVVSTSAILRKFGSPRTVQVENMY